MHKSINFGGRKKDPFKIGEEVVVEDYIVKVLNGQTLSLKELLTNVLV